MINSSHISEHRERLRGGSRSFFAASLLLPSRLSRPASVLYSFCRVADDLIDESENPKQALQALQHRLDKIYSGDPLVNGIDPDFAQLVAQYHIPKPLVQALLEGFMWDAQGRRYETIEDLYEYAARVAGSVGVMMAILMGVREPVALARAADLGVAMQLTNIARDVAEDVNRGRIYLPEAWLRECGICVDSWRSNPVPSDSLKGVLRRLLDTADKFYARADAGIGELPRDCRFGIRVARLLYAQIGRQLEAMQLDPFSGRAIVSPGTKGRLIAKALLSPGYGRTRDCSAAIEQTAFLVLAVTQSDSGQFSSQVVRVGPSQEPGVIALFLRLGLHDRDARKGA